MNSQNVYDQLRAKEKRLIYEDDFCAVFLAEPPATLGHIRIIAKQDGTLENLPDEAAERLFVLANVAASALFDLLGAQGTNILFEEWIRSGPTPHCILQVIARFQEDDIDLQWTTQKQSEAEMDQARDRIYDKTFLLMHTGKTKVVDLDSLLPKKEILEGDMKKYFERQNRRTP